MLYPVWVFCSFDTWVILCQMGFSHFVHPSVFRHLDCFYFLAVVNNVSMNFLVQFFFLINIGFLFLLVIYLRIELLDHVFTFVKKFQAVSQSDCNFCIPTSFVRRVPVSPHLCLYLLLYVLFSIIITYFVWSAISSLF